MDWINLDNDTALTKAIENSHLNKGIVIFKHSTRCSISSVAKSRLSLKWDFNKELPTYYLDLIKHRDISDLIAKKFDIMHESPQLLIIEKGKCIYNASHLGISVNNIKSFLQE